MSRDDNWLDPRPWEEFRASGVLWFVNHIIRALGWQLIFDPLNGVVPARCKFRFLPSEKAADEEGFHDLTRWLVENAQRLKEESES